MAHCKIYGKEKKGMSYPVVNPVETGENINRIRKEKGITVKDMSEYFGMVNTNSIYKWLRGETLPSLENFYALSVLLETSMNDIIAI